MYGTRISIVAAVTVLALSSLLVIPANMGVLFADDAVPGTKVMHKGLKYFVPGHRIRVEARIEDKAGVEVVRCYFKAGNESDYVFVAMKKEGTSGKYAGTLPAPAEGTQSIGYLFLIVNGANQVVKTPPFTFAMSVVDVPSWQTGLSEGNILVSTETGTSSQTLAGFSDSLTVDVAESAQRFGATAEIQSDYQEEGGPTGTADAATFGGTVMPSEGSDIFFDSMVITIGGVAVGVAGIAAILALSGGGDDGGSAGVCGGALSCTATWALPTETAAFTFTQSGDGTCTITVSGNQQTIVSGPVGGNCCEAVAGIYETYVAGGFWSGSCCGACCP